MLSWVDIHIINVASKFIYFPINKFQFPRRVQSVVYPMMFL